MDVASPGEVDAERVAALRRHDEDVFAGLVDEWSPAMLRLAQAHVHTRATAEEVVQEAWLAAFRGLDRFEGRSRLRTWVLRITANLAKTRAQRDRRVMPVADDAETGPTVDRESFRGAEEPYTGGWRQFPARWPVDPETSALQGEARQVLEVAIGRLPHRQRAVMTMRDVHGYPANEVCDLLGLTATNQRVLLHRARAALRSQVEAYFAGTVAS
ncbi:MAG: RNA polymerase sigma factor [Candidatus Dormibacteraceae bacterium]